MQVLALTEESDRKEGSKGEMMLLIVDDHAAMRRLMRRLISDLADQIEECADGEEVLAAYEQHHFSGAVPW